MNVQMAGAAIVAGILVLAVHGGEAREPPTVPKLSAGRELFRVKGCYQCHGYAGQGSVLSGPALAGRRLPPAAITAYVRAPQGAMPAYGRGVLSDQDLALIADYVATMPRGRDVEHIPALVALLASSPANRQVAAVHLARAPVQTDDPATVHPIETAGEVDGRDLYAHNCAACHGASREGGLGPALRSETRHLEQSYVARTILSPPAAMPRLSPPLKAAEVEAIATYVAH